MGYSVLLPVFGLSICVLARLGMDPPSVCGKVCVCCQSMEMPIGISMGELLHFMGFSMSFSGSYMVPVWSSVCC